MPRRALAELIRMQGDACRASGSPMYARLCAVMVDDLESGGPSREVFAGWDDGDLRSVPALRLLGGVHRIVLEGRAPDLGAAYPSVGGSSEVDPAERFLQLVGEHREELRARLADPVQTNEVGRSVALLGGFHEVARSTGLPLRILELGASAGLNLRWDHFRYAPTPDVAWGDADSPLRFEGGFEGSLPSLVDGLVVADRRGVDTAPLDATTDEARMRLLSYVWPDQPHRFERLRLAIEVARRVPAPVDRDDGVTWLRARLAEPSPGVATVVYHSIVLMYLSREQRGELGDVLEAAGERAPSDAPLAWLSLELGGEMAQVTLRQWPGDGTPHVLADCSFHGPPVRWSG